MIQLRSSRTTRNQDGAARRGANDFDPTEGLPVRKYQFVTVRVNQDANDDPLDGGREDQNKDENLFSKELPLPSFFKQLPELNQKLVRKARMANPNFTPPIWDYKKEEWVRPNEAEGRGKDPAEEAENHDGVDEDLLEADEMLEKRRKTGASTEGRFFEIKKWVPIPQAVAEKMPEPKYLADRRPGMQSLYGGAYKATNGYGTLGPMPAAGAGSTGYDLGDGAGLGNASGLTSAAPATPVRRNMPPIRKSKKRKGGPGRRKAVPVDLAAEGSTVAETETPTAGPESDGGEGSEDGEVVEQGEAEAEASAPASVPPTATEPEPEPEQNGVEESVAPATSTSTAIDPVTAATAAEPTTAADITTTTDQPTTTDEHTATAELTTTEEHTTTADLTAADDISDDESIHMTAEDARELRQATPPAEPTATTIATGTGTGTGTATAKDDDAKEEAEVDLLSSLEAALKKEANEA
ncbi:hypothetical protein LTR72_006329 [Exophiala xenobiotica]|nr:hypothetical protein LTR72_006329 [Exophiala xenobiotica]KAK5295107.1 hypothetical protein LTR14_004277 [Exophiala xenobiotica]KAK5482849.1 hypothetical protein LTR55_006247 [Exophiala xenobiotica]